MSDLRDRIAGLTTELGDPADPADAPALLTLLRLLYRIGRADLPLGRLFEGHVDAAQIVSRYGSAAQRTRLIAILRDGGALGVWNADLPGDGLRFDGDRIDGGKSFASGAGVLSHALVSVDAPGGRQLLLLDLARVPPVVDRSFWRVVGMQRSETHIVRWAGSPITLDDRIGAPGDYVREPWFSGGALRFAAVQAGGVAGIVDGVRDHLVTTGRAADPHQAGRLARLYALGEAAAGAVRTAAAAWFADDAARLPAVSAARAAVYAAGGEAIAVAQEAVGVAALFHDHPLSARLTDLAMYLRQPGPDAQRMLVGAAVAAGTLTVAL
ncbi:acyl-CoA dehydrogenase [Sphingomonas sp. Leaf67]|uniref:acyl-CoA/acyl-ACP dehydrogenase n=1 Tax=Sphingomonas sp. Leaf67 TaxID=1736230 RepID=UPI0006F3973D|nr:acyl-CoA/acyl-ACP dehydrogenase [Sphingomonas sp. Leaf67]KQN90408.1 acyl-CoA dehydrogenase [Sphingomonas sp. Leaf67]